MITKRLFDLFITIPGILILSPILLVIAVLIRLDSKGPVIFRQTRVGRGNRDFTILKFRTMVTDAEKKGLKLTVGGDPRITKLGGFLRKTKLDELPQLFNILKGEMSLVGPRPEVRRFVNHFPDGIREKVLSVPPGLTDFASIIYHDESTMLKDLDDPEKYYLEEILPNKLANSLRYVEQKSLWLDMWLVLKTIWVVYTPARVTVKT